MVGSAGSFRRIAPLTVVTGTTASLLLAQPADLPALARAGDWRRIQAMGPRMTPELARLYTRNQALRLQVQGALGRVSADPVVVDVLLDNMQNDLEPLFRDKAACALANDQIHLSAAVGTQQAPIDAWRAWVAEYKPNL